MIVTIHNRKYNDEIAFEIDELNEETRQGILDSVHSRGWEDDDCWSEVDDCIEELKKRRDTRYMKVNCDDVELKMLSEKLKGAKQNEDFK